MISRVMICVLLLLCANRVLAEQTPPASSDWLTGTWTLCEDPDRSPKDSLQFNADGTGSVIRAKGDLEFVHKHTGHAVSLLANANGYAIPVELSASPDFDKLLLYSDKTRRTSTYIRADDPAVGNCSVK